MAPRRQRFERITHTCHFTPLQLQSSEILRWAMDCMNISVNDQLLPLRVLVKDHNWGLVVTGFEIEWVRPFTFFDATFIDFETGTVLHDGPRQVLGYSMTLTANGEDVVRMRTQTHPVKLTGSEAMDAVPCGVPNYLRAKLQDDEIVSEPAPRFAGPKQCAQVESGELVGERETPFTMRRHETEIADMWQNSCLGSLAGRAREAMCFDGGDARLRDGLARPIATMSGELRRPVYSQEQGLIRTRAHWADDHVVYVHRVFGARHGPSEDTRELCATIIEHMDESAS